MKIKNETINIKIGNKQYDFSNLILNEYLKRFAKAQLDATKIKDIKYCKQLDFCLLKFDTPIENISSSSTIYNQEFDIGLFMRTQPQQTITKNQIIVEYFYNGKDTTEYFEGSEKDISDFYGKKITAIGFNVWFEDYVEEDENSNLPILAILDTSNYNIYLQENQEFNITRKDIITTDTLFYSNDENKVPGPAHLAPYGLPQFLKQIGDSEGYGILYSVGLSSYSNYIDKEFVIEKDINIEVNENEINIKGIENYLSTNSSLFCSKNIYPSSNVFATKNSYKYIILKYKIWHNTITSTGLESTDTGYYYYQAIPIDKFGKSNLKIKYERG